MAASPCCQTRVGPFTRRSFTPAPRKAGRHSFIAVSARAIPLRLDALADCRAGGASANADRMCGTAGQAYAVPGAAIAAWWAIPLTSANPSHDSDIHASAYGWTTSNAR
jgi:hypothetical protein